MTSSFTRFSIIIPTHGRPRQLERCLECLTHLDACPGGSEVIVVDDASPEPVEFIVARFEGLLNLRLVVTPRGGPAMARNAGALQACGEILAFTDDDCEPLPSWLRALDECLRLWPERLVGGLTVNAISSNPYSEASQHLVDFVCRWYEAKTNSPFRFFPSNNMAISRTNFEYNGGFSPGFPFAAAEDRDFCARWLERGGELMHAPGARVMHRHCLSLAGFCHQHFTYGRGGWAFQASRSNRLDEVPKLESWRFYRKLLRCGCGGASGLAQPRAALLMFLSQISNASGYFWQAMHSRPSLD